jgi:fermentation-respiration switch protein FrsA (DUF1100 family)
MGNAWERIVMRLPGSRIADPLLRRGVRMLWSLLFIAVGVYLGLGLLLFLTQARLIFLPQREFDALPSDYGMAVEEAMVAAADGVRIHLWFLPAARPRGTVLFCHGNAGNISHRLDTARIFLDLDMNVLLFDYRGYGRSEGRPSEPGIHLDTAAAWDWLTRERGVNPAEVVVVGRSLGGAPATRLAGSADPPPRALILESVFSSIPDMAAAHYPVYPPWLSRIVLPTARLVRDVHVPLLAIHSREDEIVPFRLGEKVFAAANTPKTFRELRGDHNHCYFLDEPAYRRILAEFLASLDQGKAPAP